ncbi:hypothetical protein DPSP01_001342 [Paraphaeosphaeria sporulosa]
MVFTKNYYAVLNLAAPGLGEQLTQEGLRKAYKTSLLAAHPDKAAAGAPAAGEGKHTVDDVKEALAVLSDPGRRGAFDKWLAAQRQRGDAGAGWEGNGQEDFVLGLDLLDLSDFEAGMPPFVRMRTPDGDEDGELDGALDFDDLDPPSPSSFPAAAASNGDHAAVSDLPASPARPSEMHEEERGGEEGEMEWTRACRCGAEKGFRIRERELEDAEGRGEKEVLVGCEGCSLWVRVGFDVEEG